MSKSHKLISRRDMVRLTGMTGLAMLSGSCPASAVPKATTQATSTPAKSSKEPSVFQNDKCRKGNSIKYANYDKDIVYPLLAFWLMLTTDEWDECFKDEKWRSRLASELKLRKKHLEQLYAISHGTELPSKDSARDKGQFTNLEAFNRVKKIWYDFIDENSFYGGRPCPGGKTLLQIAQGCKL